MEDGEELVELRDGSRVAVRPARAEDRELLARAFDQLGDDSRFRRFLGFKKQLSERELEFFTAVDHHAHEAIGAIDVESGEGVGVARFMREPADPGAAEAAVTIVDEWQGRGVGGVLLERLARRAREEGVTHFTASLLTSNKAMVHLFERLGCVQTVRRDGDTAEIDVRLSLGDGGGPALGEALRRVASGELVG
jgi:RimJ/RimL family protein N-acetyltransferase